MPVTANDLLKPMSIREQLAVAATSVGDAVLLVCEAAASPGNFANPAVIAPCLIALENARRELADIQTLLYDGQ